MERMQGEKPAGSPSCLQEGQSVELPQRLRPREGGEPKLGGRASSGVLACASTRGGREKRLLCDDERGTASRAVLCIRAALC